MVVIKGGLFDCKYQTWNEHHDLTRSTTSFIYDLDKKGR